MFRLVEANHVVQSAKHNIIESGTVLFWTALLGLPQAAQTRRVKNCKDLYENLDNNLPAKVLNKKVVLNCRGNFLGFCVVICLIECDLSDFTNSRVVTRT